MMLTVNFYANFRVRNGRGHKVLPAPDAVTQNLGQIPVPPPRGDEEKDQRKNAHPAWRPRPGKRQNTGFIATTAGLVAAPAWEPVIPQRCQLLRRGRLIARSRR